MIAYTKNMNIVEAQNISFSYGDNQVLKNITLAVPQGDYLGVIGPNGAGKTTLLKIILGLLMPAAGSVKLFGQYLKDFKNWEKIGYVPQKATKFETDFPTSVYEVVMMGRFGSRGLFHPTNSEDKKIVKRSLEQVGMWEHRDTLIGNLSGGEQQRVFIARALATQPEIIFLDEPTVGIDPKAREEFYSLLKTLNQKQRLTLVLISHDVETVLKEVQHVACVDVNLVCHSVPTEFLKHTLAGEMLGGGVKIIAHEHRH